MYRILKKLITLVVRFGYRAFYKWIPCQKKTVLFIAFHGRGCLDNPKAIYEYLINDQKFNNFHFIWALKKPQTFTNKNTKSIRYLSLQYFFYLARSTYWISNCKLPSYILKKKTNIFANLAWNTFKKTGARHRCFWRCEVLSFWAILR